MIVENHVVLMLAERNYRNAGGKSAQAFGFAKGIFLGILSIRENGNRRWRNSRRLFRFP